MKVIHRSSSNNSSSMVIIRKKSESIRICIKYRKLNDIAVTNAEPIPNEGDTRVVVLSGRPSDGNSLSVTRCPVHRHLSLHKFVSCVQHCVYGHYDSMFTLTTFTVYTYTYASSVLGFFLVAERKHIHPSLCPFPCFLHY